MRFPGLRAGAGSEQFKKLGVASESRDVLIARVQRLTLAAAVTKKKLKNGDLDAKMQVTLGRTFDRKIESVSTELAALLAQGLRKEHPKVDTLLKEKARLLSQKSTQMTRSPSGLEIKADDLARAARDHLKDLEVELSVARTELQQVQSRLGSAEVLMNGLPAAESEFGNLSRSAAGFQEVQSRIFQRLQAERLQLQIELEAARSRYEVIIPPTPTWGSTNANILKFGLAGLFVMGILAVVGVALREGLSFARRKVNEALKEKALRTQQLEAQAPVGDAPTTAITPTQVLRDSS